MLFTGVDESEKRMEVLKKKKNFIFLLIKLIK